MLPANSTHASIAAARVGSVAEGYREAADVPVVATAFGWRERRERRAKRASDEKSFFVFFFLKRAVTRAEAKKISKNVSNRRDAPEAPTATPFWISAEKVCELVVGGGRKVMGQEGPRRGRPDRG